MARVSGPTFALASLAIAAGAALLRLPFLGSVGPDEGGYAYAAWQWASGRPLYSSVWIDRPQGLMLAYRGLVSLALDPWAIRLGAVIAGALISVLIVAVGTQLVSRAAGLFAGALFAVVGVGPRIEGFTFNGELAAAVPATAAIAAALRARTTRSRALFAAAGVLGGGAMLMKQSGFDGVLVAFALALSGPAGRRGRDAVAVGGGAALPIAASLAAGALEGWRAYWSGIVASHPTVSVAARLHHLRVNGAAPARDLLLVAIVAAAGVAAARRLPVARWLVPLWISVAAAAINVGGFYWPHYYVQLVPPLCLAAGVGLDRLPVRRASIAALAVAVPALFFVGNVLASTDEHREHLIRYALGFENDSRIAGYVRTHSSPREPVFAYLSRADFYFLAERRASYPYLWAHPVATTPGARRELVRMLAAPTRPFYVVLFQHPKPNAFGRSVDRILRARYRRVWEAPRTETPVLRSVRGR